MRHNFDFCKPDCTDRKPGCHGHCEYHLGKKKEWAELKSKNEASKLARQYAAEQTARNYDMAIKCKQRFAGSNWRRYGK